MADQSPRQDRQQEFQPRIGPVDTLSADAHQFVDRLPGFQAQAARDPILNGADAERRLREAP